MTVEIVCYSNISKAGVVTKVKLTKYAMTDIPCIVWETFTSRKPCLVITFTKCNKSIPTATEFHSTKTLAIEAALNHADIITLNHNYDTEPFQLTQEIPAKTIHGWSKYPGNSRIKLFAEYALEFSNQCEIGKNIQKSKF